MTREEAIEFGNMWLQINEDSKNSSTYKFFQMALKSLEQEPKLNKIRAEIENIDTSYYSSVNGVNMTECAEDFKCAVLQVMDKYRAENEE